MKHTKRIVSVLLAVLILMGVFPYSAFAESENTPKEEVVYVNLNADGSVKEINVVNIFNLDENGRIIDYGRYESLRNMTSVDKIGYSGETVTIDAKAGKLYYEGKMEKNIMPWNISLRYYMDGKEYSASEIAGKSGALKIAMKITENKDCTGNFFEGYALQAVITLDTEKCNNISAGGTTVANVGSNKQLTYTVLPDKGADIEITADVSNFEMSKIAVNGIKLNLDIEIDNAEIKSKIDEIAGGVNDLDDGASKLNEGAKELYSGTDILNDKVGELYAGIGALKGGTSELSGGLAEIAAKDKELLEGGCSAFKGLCSAVETILNSELEKSGLQTVTLTPENYAEVLTQLLKTMDADNIYKTAYNKALAEATEQVNANAEDIYSGYAEQNADAIYNAYVQSQADELYKQVAAQAVFEQLIAGGYSNEQAISCLQTAEGQVLIAQAATNISEEQKQHIISAAVADLTDEQKAQIKAATVKSLTNEQKEQIKNGYIEQIMKSTEVTSEITAAVVASGSAVASVAKLKGQLDNYSLFYDGLKQYTSAVRNAASGADTLKLNMDTLYANVGTLKLSVGNLNDGVNKLFEGTTELNKGTSNFASETEGIERNLNGKIDSMISSATGSDINITSFVSKKNTNVKSVQFVIQTEAIEVSETVKGEPIAEEKLNFWQKLLRLFGLY